jgi:hypothetical protein
MRALLAARVQKSRNHGTLRARQWRAAGGGAMNRVKLSVRITVAQDTMLKRVAEARGLTRYQALGRAIEQGLGAMMNAPVRSDIRAAQGGLFRGNEAVDGVLVGMRRQRDARA